MNTDQKLDKVLEEITGMKVVLERHSVLHEKNSEDLAEHIRRSDAIERRVEILSQEFEEKLAPVEKHVTKVETIGKNTMYVLGIIGAIILALNELGILKKLL